jgi:hypothetical protein
VELVVVAVVAPELVTPVKEMAMPWVGITVTVGFWAVVSGVGVPGRTAIAEGDSPVNIVVNNAAGSLLTTLAASSTATVSSVEINA